MKIIFINKNIFLHCLTLLIIMLNFAYGDTVFAETKVFYATSDAHVWESIPELNLGDDSVFAVGRDSSNGGPEIWSYIGFGDITEDIPSNIIIESAELRLYRSYSSGNFIMSVKLVEGNWWELGSYGVRWSNKPAAYPSPVSSVNPTGSSNGYVIIDITEHVEKWVGEDYSRRGLQLYGSSGVSQGEIVHFDAKNHSSSSHRPRLKITYSLSKPDLYDRGESTRSFNPKTIKPNDTINISCDIYNGGDMDAEEGYRVLFLASTDRNIEITDYLIGEVWMSSLDVGHYETCNFSGIPNDALPEGTYWVGWIIDEGSSSGNVDESDEENNTAYKTGYQLTVNGSDASIIYFDPPTGSLQRNSTAQATVRIKNTGTKSRSFWVGLSFAHESTTGDAWPTGWYDIKPIESSILQPNQTEEIVFSFIIPITSKKGQFYAVSRIWDDFNEHLYSMVGAIDSTLWHTGDHPDWSINSDIGMPSFYLSSSALPSETYELTNLLDYVVDIVQLNGIYDLYLSKGMKPLLYVGISKNFTIRGIPFEVGGALYIDLADFLEVTPEGKEGWTTVWVAGDLGGVTISKNIVTDYLNSGLINKSKLIPSLGVGILMHEFEYNQKGIADYRPYPLEFGKIVTPFISITAFQLEQDSLIPTGFKRTIDFNGTMKVGFYVEKAEVNLLKFEIKNDIILAALRSSNAINGSYNSIQYAELIIDTLDNLKDEEDITRDFSYDDGEWPIEEGNPQNDLSMRRVDNNWKNSAHRFVIDVPVAASNLKFSSSGGSGDVALVYKYGDRVDLNKSDRYDGSSYTVGTTQETISIPNPTAGKYYLAL